MGGMTGSLLAMATGASATPGDQDQAGGQDRRLGMQLFEAGQELAADESGVFGDFDLESGG